MMNLNDNKEAVLVFAKDEILFDRLMTEAALGNRESAERLKLGGCWMGRDVDDIINVAKSLKYGAPNCKFGKAPRLSGNVPGAGWRQKRGLDL